MLSMEFLVTSLIVVLIPGTGVIYTVSTGLLGHRKDSVAAAIGCTAGIIPHLMASILGLSAILNMSALAFQGIKMIGVAYLFYLAWSMWRNQEVFTFTESSEKNSTMGIIIKAILINLLNPKLTLFFFAFLPQFIAQESGNHTYQMIFLGAVFMLLTCIVFLFYGLLANSLKRFILGSSKVTRRIQESFALIFAGLAVKLAFTDK